MSSIRFSDSVSKALSFVSTLVQSTTPRASFLNDLGGRKKATTKRLLSTCSCAHIAEIIPGEFRDSISQSFLDKKERDVLFVLVDGEAAVVLGFESARRFTVLVTLIEIEDGGSSWSVASVCCQLPKGESVTIQIIH
jgi:hypothetical protein